MNLWLPYRYTKIRDELNKVFPGAQWVNWGMRCPDPDKKRKRVIEIVARKIVTYVQSLPKDKQKVSSKEIKEQADMKKIAMSTFREAMKTAASMLRPDWKRDSNARSLVREDTPMMEPSSVAL